MRPGGPAVKMDTSAERTAEFIQLRSAEDRLHQACARVKKFYEQGRTVAVHVGEAADAERLDALLWTFEQGAFIPHVRLSDAEEPIIEPVVIYCGNEEPQEADVLLECADCPPSACFRRYRHVCDFACTFDPRLRELSRQRYRACQQAGYRMRFIR